MSRAGEESAASGRQENRQENRQKKGTTPIVRLESVVKEYPRSGRAVDEISFQLHKGEFAFLTGPSGAGKTTVLKLIHMEERPDRGRVRVSKFSSEEATRKDIPLLRRRVGYVFQDFRLLQRLTAAENVAFALEVTGADPSRIESRVQRLLGQVGLAAKASSHPPELSGGERQRVAIARALATDPLILLADEPTGNLDDRAAAGVLELFRDIHRRGTAVLLATHDAELLRRQSDSRVIEIEQGNLVFDSAREAAS